MVLLKKIFESAKDTDRRLKAVPIETRIISEEESSNRYVPIHCSITVAFPDSDNGTRKFEGFGGALTESSAWVLQQVPEKTRDRIIASFFSQNPEEGNCYTLARTHINSCDFSLSNWACCEKPDETLGTFSMERADHYLIPLIHAVRTEIRKTSSSSNNCLKLMISPWSPPAWMKDNNDMNNGGHLLEKYKKLWADYIVRFLRELKKRSISVWTLTVQNEPEAAQSWDSCLWSAEDEAAFVQTYLGPALKQAGFEETAILLWDHNRDKLAQRMAASMNFVEEHRSCNPGMPDYVGGAAYHWYSGDQYENVKRCADLWPEKKLIFSEGCVEGGARPGAWFTGERYAHNIINDLNSGCTGWIDWNIVLNATGGPNHVGNYCDAPVLVNIEKEQTLYNSSYYYIGHFSRFIQPGAFHLSSTHQFGMVPSAPDGKAGTMLEYTVFSNPDKAVVVILCNRTEETANFAVTFTGVDEEGNKYIIACPARGIQTLIFYNI